MLFFFLDEFKHDKVKKKKEPSCTMKCLTKCTDRTVHLFPCLKDNNNIINRISIKSFRLNRINGFASFIKKKKNKSKNKNKISTDNDGSIKTTEEDGFNSNNGDEITVSEIELREWSEPLNPALGIKDEEDELNMTSTSAFMAKPPPLPMRPNQVDQKKTVGGKKMKMRQEIREEMKHEIKQMEQEKQNVERQLRKQMTKQKQEMQHQMKQQMTQQMQQMKQQMQQEMERLQCEKEDTERRHQEQIHEMLQTLKKLKKDTSLVVATSAIHQRKNSNNK